MPETRTRGMLIAEEHFDPQWLVRVDDPSTSNFHYVATSTQGNDEPNMKHLAACWNAIELHAGGDPENVGEAVELLRAILGNYGCYGLKGVEIPEEISAQFDLSLDIARRINALLTRIETKGETK